MKKKRRYTVSNYENLPFIRMTGKWLEEIGINIGDKLEFIEGKNMIILTKVSANELKQLKNEYEIKQLQQRLNDLT